MLHEHNPCNSHISGFLVMDHVMIRRFMSLPNMLLMLFLLDLLFFNAFNYVFMRGPVTEGVRLLFAVVYIFFISG